MLNLLNVYLSWIVGSDLEYQLHESYWLKTCRCCCFKILNILTPNQPMVAVNKLCDAFIALRRDHSVSQIISSQSPDKTIKT